MIAMHHFSYGEGISLDSIMTYFRLNNTKSVDDLTQHFLMLSLCFNPKLLNS